MAGHARVRLTRTGGLAGLKMQAELDTAELEPSQEAEIVRALDGADLDRLEKAPRPTSPMRDAFQYELDVDRGGRTHRIAFSDADWPEPLDPLLSLLSDRARPVPRN
jgi:hypothetical protein